MIIQYPYILEKEQLEESWQDENGNIIPGEEKWVFVSKCRDEAGTGGMVQGADGSKYIYTALIQCPGGTIAVSQGTRIRVKDSQGNIRVPASPVQYSRKDQLHTRVWV